MKVASFLENIRFNELKPEVSLLLETDFSKEIRIVFKKGQIMDDHQAPFPIIVQVIKGGIDFRVGEEIIQMIDGDMISLNPKVNHNLTAVKESVVRLTLSKSDRFKRVKNV